MAINWRSKRLLVTLSAVATAWAYLAFVSFPLGREHTAAKAALAEVERTVVASTRDLSRLRAREARAAAEAPQFAWATHLTNSVLKPYLVETPAKFSKSIRAQGLGEARIEVVQLLPFPALPGFALAKWEVQLDKGRALPFGEVLASIENEIPLGQLRSLVIQRQAASRETAITLAFDTLVQP